jgi:hypothetical protein
VSLAIFPCFGLVLAFFWRVGWTLFAGDGVIEMIDFSRMGVARQAAAIVWSPI